MWTSTGAVARGGAFVAATVTFVVAATVTFVVAATVAFVVGAWVAFGGGADRLWVELIDRGVVDW